MREYHTQCHIVGDLSARMTQMKYNLLHLPLQHNSVVLQTLNDPLWLLYVVALRVRTQKCAYSTVVNAIRTHSTLTSPTLPLFVILLEKCSVNSRKAQCKWWARISCSAAQLPIRKLWSTRIYRLPHALCKSALGLVLTLCVKPRLASLKCNGKLL